MILYADNRPETIRSRVVFSAIILVFAIIFLGIIVPEGDLIIATRIFQASTAASVVVVYWPDARLAWKSNSPEVGDYLIVGITIGWCATLCQAMFSVIYRLAGGPLWFANADVNSLWILMSSISGWLHIMAPGAVDGKVPRRNRLGLGISIGASVAVTCLVLWSRPNIAPALEFFRPALEDTGLWILSWIKRLFLMIPRMR
jgi:hypothetical protein